MQSLEEKTILKLGNKVTVSDPCYKPGTWCQGTIDNVLEGNWIAEIKYGETNMFGSSTTVPFALIVHHESFPNVEPTEVCDFEVGVDSGMVGIFNADHYHNTINYDKESHDVWYNEICDIFRRRSPVHCRNYIISFTAYGDGTYDCYVGKNEEGKIVSIMIDFICSDEDLLD